jgi:5-methylcytosine-specific restriction endonuclease McrA
MLPSCLILNASNEFLAVCPWHRAIRLVDSSHIPRYLLDDVEFLNKPKYIQDSYRVSKVEVLGWYEEVVHSEKCEFKIPSVIRLNYCVRTKRHEMLNAPTLRNILIRDNWRCMYCGTSLSLKTATRDHVIPSAMGGTTHIENIVSSCKRCNNLKSDRPLKQFEEEYGFKLDRSHLRKLTQEEKIMSAIKRFKSKERKYWIKALKEHNIDLW